MAKIPDKIKQIAITHAPLINSVVMACQNESYLNLLEPELIKAENNGWITLVSRIRKILNGSRKQNLLKGLDEEDAGIILSILVGLQNPEAVKNLNKTDKKEHAPILIAKLVKEAWKQGSNPQELEHILITMINNDKEDINKTGMAIKLLINKNIEEFEKLQYTVLDENNKKFLNKIREELNI